MVQIITCLSNFGAYYCMVSPPQREGEILNFKSPNHSRGRGFYSPYGGRHPYKGPGEGSGRVNQKWGKFRSENTL